MWLQMWPRVLTNEPTNPDFGPTYDFTWAPRARKVPTRQIERFSYDFVWFSYDFVWFSYEVIWFSYDFTLFFHMIQYGCFPTYNYNNYCDYYYHDNATNVGVIMLQTFGVIMLRTFDITMIRTFHMILLRTFNIIVLRTWVAMLLCCCDAVMLGCYVAVLLCCCECRR